MSDSVSPPTPEPARYCDDCNWLECPGGDRCVLHPTTPPTPELPPGAICGNPDCGHFYVEHHLSKGGKCLSLDTDCPCRSFVLAEVSRPTRPAARDELRRRMQRQADPARHRCSEIAAATGGYECECGEAWKMRANDCYARIDAELIVAAIDEADALRVEVSELRARIEDVQVGGDNDYAVLASKYRRSLDTVRYFEADAYRKGRTIDRLARRVGELTGHPHECSSIRTGGWCDCGGVAARFVGEQ